MPFINDRLDQQSCASSHARPTAHGNAESDPEIFARAAVGRLNARRVTDLVREHIVGQDHVVDGLFRTLSIAQAGIADRSRPLASHLFVGPTGTGKTEVVRQLAAALRTGPEDFCRVDMSAMAQEHYAASFSGAPPGYAGSREGLSVFERSRIEGDVSMPGIVLFDEVEKAHSTVLRALLHVLDNGMLVLANGQQRFNFRNCMVFLTSNLGSREIREAQRSGVRRMLARIPLPEKLDGALERVNSRSLETVSIDALEAFFEPEFLNRIDEVAIFDELDRAAAERIAQRELELLAVRSKRRGVQLRFDPAVARLVTQRGFDPVYGARSLRREIRHGLWPQIAHQVIAHRSAGEDAARIVQVRVREDQFVVHADVREEEQ